ncbi:MAG: FHA domain-containing protein [Kiritimatiellae bacterium]|jgi:predicted component of type VI protein secretion system|nr:FHA domain-containing protein [Kiritimatiellia bacterium]
MSENTPPTQLRIRYTDPDGNQTELVLAEKPITVGRSPDADIITLDERASRMHCGIRIWDGEYYVKDLKSKNGTYLNHQRVEMAKIKPGDKIRLGNSILTVDDKKSPGTDTTMSSVQDEMSGGKGYKTILREIVKNTESVRNERPAAAAAPVQEPRSKTAKLVGNGDGGEKPKISNIQSGSTNRSNPPGSGSKIIRINRPGN